ncbi:MAG: hypothetical protein RLZZ54_700 [Cyanobacteriota bacterium]|jgi:hypothetical protein
MVHIHCGRGLGDYNRISQPGQVQGLAWSMAKPYTLHPENSPWICMFSPETWEICRNNGYAHAAFTKARGKSAGRIREGDILFAYVSKRMAIAGALIANSACAFDDEFSVYGPPGQFPYRLSCQPLAILPLNEEIKLADHFHRISIFSGLRDGRYWPVCLRNSPRDLRRRDSDYLLSLFPDSYFEAYA